MVRRTHVSIQAEKFFLNGAPTYADRIWNGMLIEGLLLNARMVQGIFDDRNPHTAGRWVYPDTGRWNALRNTEEFVAHMPLWRKHGLTAFTLNLQGGNPMGYGKDQPWHNSAFEEDGSLNPAYLVRLERILEEADWQRMVVILGIFYFGQDERLRDELAIRRALTGTLDWLAVKGYRNVLIEVNNECDHPRYEHPILRADRVHELMQVVREHPGSFLVSTSFCGGKIPTPNVVAMADFLLLHGNGVGDPRRIGQMVEETRWVEGYRPMPILFNEDDHFDFDRPSNNLLAAVQSYASWGYFDPEGYQRPPVRGGIDTERKRAFFDKLKEITGV